MSLEPLDCAHVDDGDYVSRYVLGTLSESDAEAFEAHYFACDNCWMAVDQALALKAALVDAAAAGVPSDSTSGKPPIALTPSGVSPSVSRPGLQGGASEPMGSTTARPKPRSTRGWTGRWWPVAAAATMLIAVGTWRVVHQGLARPSDETERGSSAHIVVRPRSTLDSVAATWSTVSGAVRYDVRLFRADGSMLFDREVDETSFALPRTTPGLDSSSAGIFWSVEALDPTNRALLRSRLTPVNASPSR